jgi:hypothetical protein
LITNLDRKISKNTKSSCTGRRPGAEAELCVRADSLYTPKLFNLLALRGMVWRKYDLAFYDEHKNPIVSRHCKVFFKVAAKLGLLFILPRPSNQHDM